MIVTPRAKPQFPKISQLPESFISHTAICPVQADTVHSLCGPVKQVSPAWHQSHNPCQHLLYAVIPGLSHTAACYLPAAEGYSLTHSHQSCVHTHTHTHSLGQALHLVSVGPGLQEILGWGERRGAGASSTSGTTLKVAGTREMDISSLLWRNFQQVALRRGPLIRFCGLSQMLMPVGTTPSNTWATVVSRNFC